MMPLDTQSFGLTRHWLSTSLRTLTRSSDIFKSVRLSQARKAFLAGKNQLAAVKNWLVGAGVVDAARGQMELSELGQLMAAKDERAERAWTWWLMHLHLSANCGAAPYSTFFTAYDVDGGKWIPFDDVIHRLTECMCEQGDVVEVATVKTYFAGVHQSFRPGWPLHDLALVEHRSIGGNRERPRIRRALASPADVVVAYATLLFQQAFFPNQTTLDARVLLERGVARSLGMKDQGYRESLARIHQSPSLGEFIQYRHAVNLDSVQFRRMGATALKTIRAHAYTTQDVQWP
jgi:Protein of unknown function (DUF4007)